jgi:hypothetical protein
MGQRRSDSDDVLINNVMVTQAVSHGYAQDVLRFGLAWIPASAAMTVF